MPQQILSQKNSLRQDPHQFLVASLIELPADDLEARINEEIERNLMLEEDPHDTPDLSPEDTSADAAESDYDEQDEQPELADDAAGEEVLNLWADDDGDDPAPRSGGADSDSAYSPIATYRSETTFREDLKRQLGMLELTDEERFLANYLVDSLSDNGYLMQPVSELVDDIEIRHAHPTSEQQLTQVLEGIVQSLEPVGIGARDLRECMRLQLQEHRGSPAALLALRIVDEAFDDLSHRRMERLKQRFSIDDAQLRQALQVIQSLNPSPGGMQADVDVSRIKAGHVLPDFSVHNEDGELVLTMNDPHVPDVRVNAGYRQDMARLQQLRERREDQREALSFYRSSLSSARLFIDALRQRRQTLKAVMHVIVMMQRDYFLTGDPQKLRPMVLRDVAERSGYDVSTVSRVSNSKYIETDFGVIPVRRLFTTAIQGNTGSGEAEVVSNEATKDALRQLIEGEDPRHPYSDQALADLMAQRGFPLARRTVVKYREQMGINKASLRRQA